MGLIIDNTIYATSTGEHPFPTGEVTSVQTDDNSGAGAEPFDSSPTVARSHWADTTEPEPDTKAIKPAEVEDKAVKRGGAKRGE